MTRALATALLLAVLSACGGGASSPPSGAGAPSATPAEPTPSATASATPGTSSPGAPLSSATTPRSTTRPTPTPPRPTATTSTLPAALTGHVVSRVPTSRRVVALTFDAGANADGVPRILATLRAKGVPATFFLTGRFVTTYPALSRQLAAYGRLGNHTVSHPRLTTLSDTAVRSQVVGAETTIRSMTGEGARPFFRFPYGAYDARTLRLVNGLGYAAVGWTVDSLGWQGTSKGGSAAAVAARVIAARTPGEIVLMHVGSNPDDRTTFDADALAAVIDGLRAHGYSFVTLDLLLG